MSEQMTEKQAKAWAYDLIASDIVCNMDNGCYDLNYENPSLDEAVKIKALKDLSDALRIASEKMEANQ
jgi:hypothetical protein